MILITGATGLLGSRLLFDLVSKGHAVRALRRNNSQMRNLERYFSSCPELFRKIEWMEGMSLIFFA
ncbi:MAG: NAD-dependent epimerase/dehydratase family protein [Bacteroidetes bacterium]|nr:NAD-dependent epimerase/dehydratase family protein [Bacteroidota bacterium]